MPRLIDANALLKPIEQSFRDAGLHGEDYRKIKRWIRLSPTIDAVQIVRCHDCKYWTPCESEENDIGFYGTCDKIDGMTFFDHFCAYGTEEGDGNAADRRNA